MQSLITEIEASDGSGKTTHNVVILDPSLDVCQRPLMWVIIEYILDTKVKVYLFKFI